MPDEMSKIETVACLADELTERTVYSLTCDYCKTINDIDANDMRSVAETEFYEDGWRAVEETDEYCRTRVFNVLSASGKRGLKTNDRQRILYSSVGRD